ncbi:hypothetical protein AB6735_23075 [Mucilaginibacter sp. RCC_168]|uniref:hypothetical protein n=1 Tax=Mucilaginibacter sp. RCC_168 TaxID=3239221 RepID=UPI0035254983
MARTIGGIQPISFPLLQLQALKLGLCIAAVTHGKIMNNNLAVSKTGVIKIIVLLIIVVFFILWQKYWSLTKEEIVLEGVSSMEFHGRIDSIYRDKGDHNTMKVILSGGYVYGIYADWESEVDLGDSLSKTKDSLRVKVFKVSGERKYLDYRQLVKGFKKN